MSLLDLNNENIVTETDLVELGFRDSHPWQKTYRCKYVLAFARCWVVSLLPNELRFYASFQHLNVSKKWIRDNPSRTDIIILLSQIQKFCEEYKV